MNGSEGVLNSGIIQQQSESQLSEDDGGQSSGPPFPFVNEFEVTFDDPGSYDYFCALHPWMTGQVIANEGESSSRAGLIDGGDDTSASDNDDQSRLHGNDESSADTDDDGTAREDSASSDAGATREDDEEGEDCDPSYPDACISSPPPDLDCGDVDDTDFAVREPDPHRFDSDNDGIRCET